MSERQRRDWGYRIDKNSQQYFAQELAAGRLRQGWGYLPEQALPEPAVDAGARGNLPIYHRVKQGDILLVPELPNWGEVALVEATQDFDTGYRFELLPGQKEYGHMFPARLLGSFSRHSGVTDASLRKTLRTPMRFWNLDGYAAAIEKLLASTQELRTVATTPVDRFTTLRDIAYQQAQAAAAASLRDSLHTKFQAAEWEHPLARALETLYPNSTVVHVGGKNEKEHGADLLMYVPMPLESEPAVIAIQVKDYENLVKSGPLDQIGKSTAYFEQQGSGRLYQQWLFITKASKTDNLELVGIAEEKNVRVLFEDDVISLFAQAAMAAGDVSDLSNGS